MTANDILIIAIGAFFLITGIAYLWQIRNKKSASTREKVVSWVLLLVGLVTVAYPLIHFEIHPGQWFSNEAKDSGSNLMGPEVFDKKPPLNPDNYPEAGEWYGKGTALWNSQINGYDSTEKVMEYFTKSIELYPTAEAYTARGQLKMQLSMMQSSLSDFEEAIELKPEYGNAYFQRATVYYIMDNRDLACDDLRKAMERKVPGAADAYNMICN